MVDIEKGIKAYSREGLAEFMKSAGMARISREANRAMALSKRSYLV